MEVLFSNFNFILILTQVLYLVFAILIIWLLVKIIQFFTLKNRELKLKNNLEK